MQDKFGNELVIGCKLRSALYPDSNVVIVEQVEEDYIILRQEAPGSSPWSLLRNTMENSQWKVIEYPKEDKTNGSQSQAS